LAVDAPAYESELLARSRPLVSSSVWKKQGLHYVRSMRNSEKPELSSPVAADFSVVRFQIANDTSQNFIDWTTPRNPFQLLPTNQLEVARRVDAADIAWVDRDREAPQSDSMRDLDL
jgi:hypothetical protein